MSSGKEANFTDSGYDVSSLNIYDSNNNLISLSTPQRDIYTTTQTVGVIMINSSGLSYSIYCSVPNMGIIGSGSDIDDYYIVYPGWGFTLYTDFNYNTTSQTYSRTYINTSNTPQLFTSLTPINGVTVTKNIKTTTNTDYPVNSTNSIKVYFRGIEVTIPGLS
jgi:hypothetical protein